MTIYSLDVLLFLFGTSLLFHVLFYLLILDLHTHFSELLSLYVITLEALGSMENARVLE